MSNVQTAVNNVDNSQWLDRGVRIGLVAYGIVHLLVAWLAFQIIFGHSSGAASSQGALKEVAQQSYGTALLWVIAVGFLALAIWQALEAFQGHRSKDGAKRVIKRVGSAGKAVLYVFLGYSAAKTALGESSSSSSKDTMTAKVLDLPGGQLIVGAVGLGIIGVGGYLVSRAVRKSFENDLDSQATSGSKGTTVVRLGQAGYTAKGVSLAGVGALFVWAAATYDPKKAGGLDVALRELLDEPLGPWLVGLVAVGIAAFGVFCFFWARYADTSS